MIESFLSIGCALTAGSVADLIQRVSSLVQSTNTLTITEDEGRIFFCVPKLIQRDLHQQINVRNTIFDKIGLPRNTKILQIIGDSQPFTGDGTIRGRNYLKKKLDSFSLERRPVLLLYGYTYFQNTENSVVRGDGNSFVSDLMNTENIVTVANVVDVDTPKALREYCAQGSSVQKYYYLVHGNAGFGDDITSSGKYSFQFL